MKISKEFKYIQMALLLIVSFSSCAEPGPAEKAGKKLDETVEKAGDKMSDASDTVENSVDKQMNKASVAAADTEITAKIKAIILAERGLDSLQISVDTVKGVVTLSGKADSKANSDKAESLAEAVSGVSKVINQLTIQNI